MIQDLDKIEKIILDEVIYYSDRHSQEPNKSPNKDFLFGKMEALQNLAYKLDIKYEEED